jgi:hypothetical protein
MIMDKAKIESLAVHIDQLLLSHERSIESWLPLPKDAARDLQELLGELRPGPAAAEPETPAGSSPPADPALPGAKVPDVSPDTSPQKP